MVRRVDGVARSAAGGGLLAGGVAAIAVAGALCGRLVATASTPLLGVDDIVEAAVLGLGLAAASWLALSCVVGALCVAARTVGATWRSGERAVQRYAPSVVRRALGVGVATSLAVGLASGAGAVAPPGDASPPGSTAGTSATAELGWVGVEAARVDSGSAASVGAVGASGSGGDAAGAHDDFGWVVSDDARPASEPAAVPHATPTAPPTRSPQATVAPSATPSSPSADGATADVASPGWRWSPIPWPAGPAAPPVDDPGAAIRPDARQAVTATAVGATVVVHAGDSLWSIAEAHLGRGGAAAGVEEIAAAWPAWYAANADVIGDDPDSIRPGQRLVVPTSTERSGR
ncbi:LysM peptidoglycan-binding domain-containing protein [Cellulomonas sp. PhB150]|uniref:LysM peptidoglycan-binding domain-containing protein n=1 Tax=Cellulomonas sp. PhB150 TaxID=2485188 RepID=UPI000F9AB392|nr:LysM peptidoglycan-binding domain-containing protein [Cellulomonas sp. PhB150]ROS31175.1 LysM domain-containing protein [Cellulomonas sp. PhB150]